MKIKTASRVLLKNVRIVDPGSEWHLKKRDILIRDGKISKIGQINDAKADKIEEKNLHVSPGWIDLQAQIPDPGMEYKENLSSGLASACQGGFTSVCIIPNEEMPADSKTSIEYLLKKSDGNIVTVLPIGAVSKGMKGDELAELYDMKSTGAHAFSDGKRTISNSLLLKKALLYSKTFDGLIMHFPNNLDLMGNGQMNEGEMSTLLGLEGIPTLAEEIGVSRDLKLAEYCESRIHFTNISTENSIKLIETARKTNPGISCAISSTQLLLDDSALSDYNSHFKVLPPLRTKGQTKKLIQAVKQGKIDAIISDHSPENIENKDCEFEHAAFGMINLETAYAAANTALEDEVALEAIIDKFTTGPRRILGLPNYVLKEGIQADLTLFNPSLKWTYEVEDSLSLSKNSGLEGKKFIGKPLGIINNGLYHV